MSLKFGIGASHFATLRSQGCFFMDKSIFIKEIMDDGSFIMLFTRPRRFGKTLTLSMLEEFYSLRGGNFFEGLKILEEKEFCQTHQNQYPVISLSFKDCKQSSFEAIFYTLSNVFSKLYTQHSELLQSDKLLEHQKAFFQKVLSLQVSNPTELSMALPNLIGYLHSHTGRPVMVLIDEYDTPIHSAYLNNFFDPIIEFMRTLFGAALKDNPLVKRGILTGISRVAQESLFSGLNNLEVFTVFRSSFSSSFGFTKQEVLSLIPSDTLEWIEPITTWYNGYSFGGQQIYNPWSILQCLKNDGKVGPYWLNTSDNHLVFKLIEEGEPGLREAICNLIEGEPLTQEIRENLSLTYLERDSTAIWTLLLHTGYLTASNIRMVGRRNMATLTIPNEEVKSLFDQMVQGWFQLPRERNNAYTCFLETLERGDIDAFAGYISKYIMESGSYFDFSAFTPEKIFHVFILGLIVGFQHAYTVSSNREAGLGRADLVLVPIDPSSPAPAILLEFKVSPQESELDNKAREALEQIRSKKYDFPIERPKILVGLAFSGKKMQYAWERS